MKIPLILWQTWRTKTNLSEPMANAIDSLRELNPEYDYRLCDDAECRNYIAMHFPINVLKAYDDIVPGAFKADLWRYCVLYKEGGVYIDIDFSGVGIPLRKILLDSDTLVSTRDQPKCSPGIMQGFLAAVPNHPVLKETIDAVVQNITERKRHKLLDITGPMVMGHTINKMRNATSLEKKFDLGIIPIVPPNINIRLLHFDHQKSTVSETPKSIVLFHTKFKEYQNEQTTTPYYTKTKRIYVEDKEGQNGINGWLLLFVVVVVIGLWWCLRKRKRRS